MAEYRHRPRHSSSSEEDISPDQATGPGVNDAALTPVPPQTAVSQVEQNGQSVPLPGGAAQGINAAQQQAAQQQAPQQQMLAHAVQPPPPVPDNLLMMPPPPPYYPEYGAGMPQQYPYMYPAVQPQMFVPPVPAEPVKVTTQSKPISFKVQCKASYSICTGWKGILEIAARVGVIVLAVICLGLSSVILNTIDSNTYLDFILSLNKYELDFLVRDVIVDLQSLIKLTRSLAGYMIFVAIVASLVEIPTILGRFTLRAGLGTLRILHVVDAIAAVILAIFFLCGMAPAASYSAQWGKPPLPCAVLGSSNNTVGFTCDDQELTAELASLSAVGFLGLVVMIFLTAWTIIAALSGWDRVDDDSTESRANADSNARSAQ